MNTKTFKTLIFSFISVLFTQLASAQTPKQFTHDKVKFLAEMQAFLESSNEKETKDFFKIFTPVWESTSISDAQRERIYTFCETLLKKRKKASDFNLYLQAIMNFVKYQQPVGNFDPWMLSLEKTIEKEARGGFSKYLEISAGLFKDNTLYESRAVRWAADNNNYVFSFDSIPVISFSALTLACHTKGDSSVILSTKGKYYPTEEIFKGENGRVTWQRAGLEPGKCYAEFDNFKIDVTKSQYNIDSVTFHNPDYFKDPLFGLLTDKVKANLDEDNATYPRFDSYLVNLQIKDLQKNVDYEGGFSMHGAKFIGSGNKANDAILTFRWTNPDTKIEYKLIKARAKNFVIKKDRISTEKASITLYWDKDSLFHPGLELKFNIEDRELALIRNEKGMGKTPFFDTYHKVDLYVEGVYWKIDDPVIGMRMISGGAESKALFESANFWDDFRYTKIQGLDDINPLIKIKKYSEIRGTKILNASDIAGYFKISDSEMRGTLMRLSTMGFLIYNVETDVVTIKDRLYDYINAKSRKTDYDVIQFNSVISKYDNASINLLNFDVKIRGVAQIFLSDSQNVFIFPREQEVILQKNRDFTFDGKVVSGRFDIFGKEFAFNYDEFKIDMKKVDSLRMKVPEGEPDEFGKVKLVPVRTVLQDLEGEVLIDHPNNKSGLEDFPKYPVFNSKRESFVYYDKKSIQRGAYDKERFYFRLEPFTVDSLDNFTKEGLAFDGEFMSAGIFPDMKETLKLQPDFSLGFVKETPSEGYPVYGGKGQYSATISLSNQGLKGDGTLDYLTSTSTSKEFIFYPDSMNAVAQDFVLREQAGGVQYPPASGKDVAIHWEPKKEHFYVSKINSPIDMYASQSVLHGSLDLTPTGLTGNGKMEFVQSELESEKFVYQFEDFRADTSNFKLKGSDAASLAFSTDNVNAHINFKERWGEFKSNGQGSFVDFPENQYICYIDQFKWYMDKEDIEITTGSDPKSLEMGGSKFISVHPAQDSLQFIAPSAHFSLKDYTLAAQDVKKIDVADAEIYPDGGDVLILKHARMQTLESAKIMANRTTKYHNFYDATIDITSRKSYKGKATYDYVDVAGQKRAIKLDPLTVDSAFQTYGRGDVAEEENFTLSPNFKYKGTVELYASKPNLRYTGSTRIVQNCEGIGSSWLKFDAEIDPKEIFIPIEKNPRDAAGKAVSTGIALQKDSTRIYPTFLSPKINTGDIDIVTAEGYLFYDNATKEYRISNKEKLRGATVPGNYISLSESCIATGQGKLDLGIKLGQVELTPVGYVYHNMNNDSTKFDLYLGVNFFFNDESMRIMTERLATFFPPLDAVYYGNNFEKALYEIMGKEKGDKKLAEMNLYGSFKKFPEELGMSLFLTDVKLEWNTNTSSYRYKGYFGVGSANKVELNKMMYGMIELTKKRSGDKLAIYLEPGEDTWYYFEYSKGLLGAISSDPNFNNPIKDAKPESRMAKTKEGELPYQYNLSSEIKKRNFVKSFTGAGADE